MKKVSMIQLKKSLLIVLAILLFLSVSLVVICQLSDIASAAEETTPLSRYLYYGELTEVNGVQGYIITSYQYHGKNTLGVSSTKSAVIPAQFNGYPILGIADGVFGGAGSINYVTFNRIIDTTGDGLITEADNNTLAYSDEDIAERNAAYQRMPDECKKIGTAIRDIGAYCFSASDVIDITFPASVASFGDGCFFNCMALKHVRSIDENGTSHASLEGLKYLKTIGSKCFTFDSSLTDFVFPDDQRETVANGSHDSFDIVNPTSYYPEGTGLYHIGDSAFQNIHLKYTSTTSGGSGSGAFVIPASVGEIIEGPFEAVGTRANGGSYDGAGSILFVKGAPGTITYYPWGCSTSNVHWNTNAPGYASGTSSANETWLYNTKRGIIGPYTGTKAAVTIPTQLGSTTFTNIASGTFCDNSTVTSVAFATNWKNVEMPELAANAFRHATKLTTITNLPDSIEKIGSMAFQESSKLTSITTAAHSGAGINLPNQCRSVGFWAFKSCGATAIHVWASGSAADFTISQSAFLMNHDVAVRFENMNGDIHAVKNVRDREEEYSVWDYNTFPFGLLTTGSTIYSKTNGTVNARVSVEKGIFTCIILSEPSGGQNGTIQITNVNGTALVNAKTPTGSNWSYSNRNLTLPSYLTYNNQRYDVKIIGKTNGDNESDRTIVTSQFNPNGLITLKIPEGVVETGYMMLSGSIHGTDAPDPETHKNTTGLILPDSLEVIGDWCFFGSVTTELQLPKNLRTIGLYAFRGNTLLNETLVIPGYTSQVYAAAFPSVTASSLTDIYYLQYRTQASDKTFSRKDGLYMQFSGKNASSVAGAAGIKGVGGATPKVHYMDDYTPYVFEIGAQDLSVDRTQYVPVINHASNEGNHAYDSPYDDAVFATPKEKIGAMGEIYGYSADIRFGVRMMTQENKISDVQQKNGNKVSEAITQDGKIGGTTVAVTEDFYMVFLDDALDSGDYVFTITYTNEGLKNAIIESGSNDYDATSAFTNTFSVTIDIYAQVKFEHVLAESIGGILPPAMSEDDEGKALLKSPERKYTQSTGTSMSGVENVPEVIPSDGEDVRSTVTLPTPSFNHQSAEFVGWTKDKSIGGKVWIGDPGEGNYIPAGGNLTVNREELDENGQITVYSVFRLKLNKTPNYDWDYGDDPNDKFYRPTDGVAAGTFTMFREGSDGVWRAEQVVSVEEGRLETAFANNFNTSTHAGRWVVLQGDQKDAWEAAQASTTFEEWCNSLYADGTSYDISEFTVDRLTVNPTVRSSINVTYGTHIYGAYDSSTLPTLDVSSFTTIEDYIYGSDSNGQFININLPGVQTTKDAFDVTLTLNGREIASNMLTPHVGDSVVYTVSVKNDVASGIQDYEITDGSKTGTYTVSARSLALDVSLYRTVPTEVGGSGVKTALSPSRVNGLDTYTWTYYGSNSYEELNVSLSLTQPENGGLFIADSLDDALPFYVPDFDADSVKAGSYDVYVRLSNNESAQINKDYTVSLINNNNANTYDSVNKGYLGARVTINKLTVNPPVFSDLYFGTEITAATVQGFVGSQVTVVVPSGENDLVFADDLDGAKKATYYANLLRVAGLYNIGEPNGGSGTYFSTLQKGGLANPEHYWFAGTYTVPLTIGAGYQDNFAWVEPDRSNENQYTCDFTILPAELTLSTDANRNVYYQGSGKDYALDFGQGNGQTEKGLVTVTIYNDHGSQAALQIWGGQGGAKPSDNAWSVRQFTLDGSTVAILNNAGTYTYRFELRGYGAINFKIVETKDEYDYQGDDTFKNEHPWKNVTDSSAEIEFVINKAQIRVELKGTAPTDTFYYDGTDKAANFFAKYFKLVNAVNSETWIPQEYDGDKAIHGYRVTYRIDTTSSGFGTTDAINAGYYVLIVALQGSNATNNIEFVADGAGGANYTLENASQIIWNTEWTSEVEGLSSKSAPAGTVFAIAPAELTVSLSTAASNMVFCNSAYDPTTILSLSIVSGHGANLLTTSDYTITISGWTPPKSPSSFDNTQSNELLHAGKYTFTVTLVDGNNPQITNNYRFVSVDGAIYTVDSASDDVANGNEQVLEVKQAGLRVNDYFPTNKTWMYSGNARDIANLVSLAVGTPNPSSVMPSQDETDGYSWNIQYTPRNSVEAQSADSLLNAGVYTLTISLNGSAENDYTVYPTDFTYTITPDTLSVTQPNSVVYNAEEQEAEISVLNSGRIPSGEYTTSYTAAGGNAQLGENRKPLNAGTYTLTVTFSKEQVVNYDITGGVAQADGSYTVTRTFTVTKATINVGWGDPSCGFDGVAHKKALDAVGVLQIVLTNAIEANVSVLPTSSADGYTQDTYEFWLSYNYIGWYAGDDLFIHAGTYSLTAHLKDGNFQFDSSGALTQTFNFVINPHDISTDKTLALEFDGGSYVDGNITGNFYFNGLSVTPLTGVSVTFGSVVELKESTDYNVNYSNNVNASSSAELQISGRDDYQGTVTKKFTILPRSLGTSTVVDNQFTEGTNSVEISVDNLEKSLTYNRQNFTFAPRYSLARDGSEAYTLISGSGYDLGYWKVNGDGTYTKVTDIQEAGTYYVVAQGQGNFEGAYFTEVTVERAKVSVNEIASVTFNRNVQLPTITFSNKSGGTAVPQEGEWGVYYIAQHSFQDFDMASATDTFFGLPSYADIYTVYVMLLGEAQNNFEIIGANAEERTLSGSAIKDTEGNSVDVITHIDSADDYTPVTQNLSGDKLTFGAGCLWDGTYTINRLKISVRQVTSSVVYDYAPNQGDDKGATANSGRHLNTALEVEFHNVGGVVAEIDDVPYQIYILNADGTIYAVFHYTLNMSEGNYAHLGPCSDENHGVSGDHKHMHFTYAANGTINWDWDNSDVVAVDSKTVGDCIQELRNAFTNVGSHRMVLVLDNGNYVIEGEGNAFDDSNVKQPSWYKSTEKISQSLNFEITKATLTPFLFDSTDEDKTPINGSGLQFTFDGVSHRLWVWFTNNANADVLPDNEIPQSNREDLTATNYWAQFGYSGWAGTFDNSTDVADGTHNYVDVGTYTVHIALKEDGNFQFVGGTTETTLTYNINTLAITQGLLNLDLSHGSYTMGADEIVGDFVYVARAWEPVTRVYIQVGGAKTPLDSHYYSLQYLNNFNKGTATVQISGTRNYSGTISLTFTISPKSLGTAQYNDEPLEGNDSEITETLLTATSQSFVYNKFAQTVNVAFEYNPSGFDQVVMTNADFTLTYYVKGDDGSWSLTQLSSIINAGTYRVVATGRGNYTGAYVVEFTVGKATVELVAPSSKTYNRNEQEADIYFNNLDGNNVTPTNFTTSYVVSATQTLMRPDNGNPNAQLGANRKPYYAGKYDVTVTLTLDDLKNFQFRAENWDEAAPTFSDSTKGEFEITQLSVYAVQRLTTATYNGQTHFFGDGGKNTYGGIGAWTLTFTAMDGRTKVNNIGYTIKYTTPDGKEVVVRFGGDLVEDQFTYGGQIISFEELKGYNLFRDVVWDGSVGSYSYTASFDHANFVFAEQAGGTSPSMPCTFTVTPAVVSLDSFASRVYNALEQEPDIRFSLVNATAELSNETVNSELSGQYSLAYAVRRDTTAKLGDTKKPVDVGTYNVTVTLDKHNYAFDSNDNAESAERSQQFEITPLNINEVTAVEFVIPDKVYTGTAIENEITQVTVTVGDKIIVFKKGATADNEVELTDQFTIIGYNNNVHAGTATVTIRAGGNFTETREVLNGFKIEARNIIVRIENHGSVYGQDLALSSVETIGWTVVDPSEYDSYVDFDWNWESDWSSVPSNPKHYVVYRTDSLGIDLGINGGKYSAAEGGALLVGTYSITDHSAHIAATSDYNITFVGSWSGADDNFQKAGTYTVTPREIVLTIGNLSAQYGDNTQATIIAGEMLDKNTLLVDSYTDDSYTGAAILAADKTVLFKGITLSIVHKDNWSASAQQYLNAGSYAIIAAFSNGDTQATYYIDGSDSGTYNVGDQYKITLAGRFSGDGTYDADSGFDIDADTPYSGHAGTFTVTPREITITITHIQHEYNKEEPTGDELKWMLKEGSSLAAGDDESILGIILTKAPGVDVGYYSVTGAYTKSGSYIVNFENDVNAVQITPRKVVVNIADQYAVYGEEAIVGQSNWHATLSADSKYSGVDAIVSGDSLGVTLTKEFGADVGVYYITGVATNGNYQVTWEGSWTADQSTTKNTDGDPADNTAGMYTITKRKVQIIVCGQSGVYGGNQHLGIDAVKNTNWKVGSTDGEFKSLLEADDLGIVLKVVYNEGRDFSAAKQLNVGWYTIRITYSNANYDVTFVGDNSNLSGAPYVEEFVEQSNITPSFRMDNMYYVFARRLTVTINPQTSEYQGINKAPTLKTGPEWWSVTNVLNGSVPPIVEGDSLDMSVKLSWAENYTEWNVGTYYIVAQISAEDNPNYVIDKTSVNGVYTITPKAISVLITDDGLTHEYDGTSADKNLQRIQGAGTKNYRLADGFALADGDSLDSLGITLTTSASANAGSYQISGNAENSNYAVTFVGSWEAKNTEKTDGIGGTYTITPRELTVVIKNHTSVYGETLEDPEGESNYTIYHNGTTDNTLVGDGDLKIELRTGLSGVVKVGQYNITATWENNSNYAVTFYGANYNIDKAYANERQGVAELNQEGHTTQNYGLYFITPRMLKVHVNNQGGVFGGLTYTNLNKLEGTSERENGWYITGFENTDGISERNVNNKKYVMPGDSLSIDLVLHNDTHSENHTGRCAISATCGNDNYKVTFVGDWDGHDEHEGTAGIFEVSKREITVTILDVEKSYDGTEQSVDSRRNFGWTEQVTNDSDNNNVTFVTPREGFAPQMKVEVGVSGAKNVDTYAIYIVIKRDGVTIFDSRTSTDGSDGVSVVDGKVTITTNEYVITLVGSWERTGEANDPQISKAAGTYTITPKNVTLTIKNFADTYGEITLEKINAILANQDDPAWQDLWDGIVPADLQFIKQAITLQIRKGEDIGSEALSGGYINAGTYYIHGSFDGSKNDVCGNYNITFRGISTTAKTGILTVSKRSIGLRVQNAGTAYGDDLTSDWNYAEISMVGTTGSAILAGDKAKFAAAIKFEILDQQLSGAGKLKVGEYPIWMSVDETKDVDGFIANNYDITFSGLWGGSGAKDGVPYAQRAGIYKVSKKNITVTDITGTLQSEYGDEVPTVWNYTTNDGDILEGDKVTVVFSTDASATADARRYLISVELGGDGADNDNYTMTEGPTVYYTIVTRKLTIEVEQDHTIIYGDEETLPAITTTRTKNGDGNWRVGSDDVEFGITYTGEARNNGHLRVKSGGYDFNVYIYGDDVANYEINNNNCNTAKYIVTPRPVDVTINDASAIYGEREAELHYAVERATEAGRGLISGDSDAILNIILTRSGLNNGRNYAGYYAITGQSSTTDYDVKFVGDWGTGETSGLDSTNDGKAGIYQITKRPIRIVIHNQSAVYGEAVIVSSVKGVNWDVLEAQSVDGKQYYGLKSGDNLELELYLSAYSDGTYTVRPRGAYQLQYTVGNDNYDVTVVPTPLDASQQEFYTEDYKTARADGNGRWGARSPISDDLRTADHGYFFVTVRTVYVNIKNQSGVYGDAYNLLQTFSGDSPAYTVSLGSGLTGEIFMDGLSVTFSLVTTAYGGEEGQSSGTLSYAGQYPIFGDKIKASRDGAQLKDNDPILTNYSFEFTGEWTGHEEYPSGSTYANRVGVFTVQPRRVTVRANKVEAVYGTYKDLSTGGGTFLLNNQKDYSANATNSIGSAFVNGDEDLMGFALTVEYLGSDLSTGRALKVRTLPYTIVLTSTPSTTSDNDKKAVDSYDITLVNATLTVTKANININIASGQHSTYGDKLTLADVQWNSKGQQDKLYTIVGDGYVTGDVLDFTLLTSLIDYFEGDRYKPLADGKYPAAGNYPIYVTAWLNSGDNANYNTPTYTGSFTGGIDPDDSHYANIAGIYTVRKKTVTVTIDDKTVEYGDEFGEFTYHLPTDWKVGNDTDESIKVLLSVGVKAGVSVGTYAITGAFDSDNYEVKFEGSWLNDEAGTLTVSARKIVVVLRPQTSVYGDNPGASSTTDYWFVVKDNTKVTAATLSTSNEWRTVFGVNTIKELNELLVTLTKGTTARDTENGTNDGNGLYGGVYDIIGQCNNSNYDVTFTKFVAEDTNYGAITDNGWGEYKITPREITIQLLPREAVYGSGDEVRYGASLSNTKDVAWRYADGSKEFVTGHEQFLSFYLIGTTTEKDTLYVPVGSHDIVAHWADGIGDTEDANYRLKTLCYKVVFENGEDNELFTVIAATILQNDRAAIGDESFSGTLWNKTEVYRGDKFNLGIDEKYLMFAGNVLYTAQTLNNTFDHSQMVLSGAKVTYKDLKLNGESRKDGALTADDLLVDEFGVWTVTVCISNDNHNDVEFTLTLTIMQAELTVTLDGTLFNALYGEYLADGIGPKAGASSFAALEQAVKEWLFSTDKMVITAIAGSENLFGGNLERIIKYLAEDATVGIAVNATSDDAGAGGYLAAKLYSISFASTGNISIKFDRVYSVVSIAKRDITVEWSTKDEPDGTSTYEDCTKYDYNYDGEQHLPIPNTKDVLKGDLVADGKYGYQIYLLQNGSWNPSYTISMVGIYRVTIVVDYNTASDNNSDIGNYNVVPVTVYVEIKAVSITVTIHDITVEYGEDEINPNAIENAWEIIVGKELLPEGEDLFITLTLQGYDSSLARRPVGDYVISGEDASSNYDVTFVSGTYKVTKRKVIVTVHDLSYMYGSNPEDEDFNFAELGDLAYSTSREGIGTIATQAQATTVPIFLDDLTNVRIRITLTASSADYTSTGYLKASTAGYRLDSTYNTNGNYDITFKTDREEIYSASTYAKLFVTQRTLNVNIQTRSVTYGDARPTMPMNYSVVGWTPEDEKWFATNRDTPASFLSFEVRSVTGVSLDETKAYDPVGEYIIQLVGNTAEVHEIGGNYIIIVTGEWNSDEHFADQSGKAGIYTVNPKPIAVTLTGAKGEYGDNRTDQLGWELISRLAGDETRDVLNFGFDLQEVILANGHTNNVGIYTVKATINNPNYVLDGEFTTTYEIVARQIDIRVLDQSYEYGDRHGDFIASLGYGIGWTALRTGIDGNGIAYADDLIVTTLRLHTNINNNVFVNDYADSIEVDNATLTDANYQVNNIVKGTLHVVPREITIRLTAEQRSEYGEEHPFSTQYNEDWTATRTHHPEFANSDEATVLVDDIYDIRLYCDIDRTSHAGSYTLRAEFNNPNYKVTTVEGSYVITPRKITVTLENATSEYGDAVGALTYRVSRVGGNALVNGDELDITLNALLPSGAPVDGTTHVGKYPIIVTASNNPDYEITFAGEYTGELPDNRVADQAGVYEVTKRQIVVTFDGESEYGDPIDPHGASYRANGKSGPALVNGDDLGYDYVWIDDPNNEENLVGGYPKVGEYRLQVIRPSEHSSVWDNYDVQDDAKENSVYRVVPRKVTVTVDDLSQVYGDEFVDPNTVKDSLLHFARTTAGKSGAALLNDGDITADNISVALGAENRIWYVGNYAMTLTYTVKEEVRDCYDVTVVNGNYVITPRPITVHINSNTVKYGDEFESPTYNQVEGLQTGDDLNILLQVLWMDGLTDDALHNVGIYEISGSYDNPNYTVTFEGSLGVYGAYAIEQADNFFTKQYTGDGDVDMGDPIEESELPTAKWGNDGAKIEYYLDAEMTVLADFDDIVDATAGTYYVKVTVDESLNWKGAVTNFVITVVNQLSLPDGLDITTYVMIYASQFVILTCALIFIRRRKENKKQKNK